MTAELGHYALIMALAFGLVQSFLPLIGVRYRDPLLMASGSISAVIAFLATLTAFAALTSAYVSSDFSVMNVWQNSHTLMPMLFKVTGVWGNHEGSMLLWVLVLALFSALVAAFAQNLPATLKALVLAVQGWLLTVFVLFILLTSNPFERLIPPPLEGRDLNPILQDIGLAIHPPLLYLGYVGFSLTFSFAMAALISGRIDAAWARFVRPWALVAWITLTVGIAMGSYWAYYELGWGGWWFWDPVENASFMPWLLGTALIHSALVMEKREALKIWTILLAILTFSFSLLGTFLVRSGVLTSVHSFASDPTRGVFILAILVMFIGGSLVMFTLRANSLKPGGLFQPISREGALVFNNLILVTATLTVLVGTLYPLVLEAINGTKISVGAPYFNLTFGPIMIPLLLVLPIGPLLSWKRSDLLPALSRLWFVAGLALAVTLVLTALKFRGPVLSLLAMGIAFWVILGSLCELVERSGKKGTPLNARIARIRGLPRTIWGTALAHMGTGLLVLGIVGATAFGEEYLAQLKPGETVQTSKFELTYDGLAVRKGPNYDEEVVRVSIRRDGELISHMQPSKRIYPARKSTTTEAAINTFFLSQLYVSPGETTPDQTAVIHVWWKPMVLLIWLGPVMMAMGGLISLSDRRLRIGVPTRSRNKRQPANA